MKNTPKFSVITPVHLWSEYRVEMFIKTTASVARQAFKDFEWVVVDDGSTMPFLWENLTAMMKDVGVSFTLIKRPHEERVIAYNEAFKAAKGEWFTLLDSDDEYRPDTLMKLSKIIEKYPKDKMFNFGCAYQYKDGATKYRDPFTPKRKAIGHVKFGGGNIVNGTFIFNRSVYEDLGAYPPTHIVDVDTSEINYGGKRDLFMGSPYDFSAAAQLEFPEIREFFMVDVDSEPNKVIKELGNPWGQDYYLFYKYTRKYHSRIIKEYLYLVNPR